MGRFQIKARRWMCSRLQLRASNIQCAAIGGVLLLMIALIVRVVSGSPYRSYLMFRHLYMVPPLSLLTLLNGLLTFGLGFALGLAFSVKKYQRCPEKYRAGMIFVLLSVCWFAAYSFFFRGCMPFPALICLILTGILTVKCVSMFQKIHILCGWILGAFLIWNIFLIILLIMCISFI